MTEREWLDCQDPDRLLKYLKHCRRYRVSRRKVRLFLCRCVRRVSKRLAYQESDAVVRAAERYADGLIGRGELATARLGARQAINSVEKEDGPGAYRAARAAWCLGRLPQRDTHRPRFEINLGFEVLDQLRRCLAESEAGNDGAGPFFANLLREVVGNPFRKAGFDPAWLTANDRLVKRLAASVYTRRDWDEMPILGDALEDAGCTDAAILEHCRADTVHCRGCWVLDGLLGRE